MSHITSIKTELRDIEAVADTCNELGLTLKRGQKTYRWYGQAMGDVPEGFTKADLGKCEHAIGVPGTDWEIGLARANGKTGFTMLFDFYGTSGAPLKNAIGGVKGEKFLKTYAAYVAMRQFRKAGHTCRRTDLANGQIKIVATVNA